MRARALLLTFVAGAALACGGDGGESSGSGDRVADLLAQLQAETDSVVLDAMRRNGVTSLDPPEPGLTETYIRSPRRHSQVKRYYDSWKRVDAALTPTIHQTMTQAARRLRQGADLGRIDSMDFDLEVSEAIRNRRRELEVREMLADQAIYLYDQGETSSIRPPTVINRREPSLDSVARERRALTPEQRRQRAELERRSAESGVSGLRRAQEMVEDSRARDLTRHTSDVQRLQDELTALLARRAAGRFSPRT